MTSSSYYESSKSHRLLSSYLTHVFLSTVAFVVPLAFAGLAVWLIQTWVPDHPRWLLQSVQVLFFVVLITDLLFFLKFVLELTVRVTLEISKRIRNRETKPLR